MEFFRVIRRNVNESVIQERIALDSIEKINSEIIVLGGDSELFQIGCIWGEFTIRRDNIKGGIRFSMLNCPNALAWTITSGFPPLREGIVIHLTINRERKAQEFIDEINEFLNSWEKGLIEHF